MVSTHIGFIKKQKTTHPAGLDQTCLPYSMALFPIELQKMMVVAGFVFVFFFFPLSVVVHRLLSIFQRDRPGQ